MRPAESILEDMLDQMKRTNAPGQGNASSSIDNLIKAMQKQQKTAEDAANKADIKKREAEKRELLAKFDKSITAFCDGMKKSALGSNSTTSGINTAASAINSIANGIESSLTTMLGKTGTIFGGLIGGTLKFGAALLQVSDGLLNDYKKVFSAGLNVQGGMAGLYKTLGASQLSLSEFMTATEDSRAIFNSMNNNEFSSYMKSIKSLEMTTGSLGLSTEQEARYMMQNLKQRKIYDTFDRASNAQSTAAYIKQVSDYSKVLGISIDEISKKSADAASSFSGVGLALSLQENGLDPKKAEEVSKTFNASMASMGDDGVNMGKFIAKFAMTGGMDDPSKNPFSMMYTQSSAFSTAINSIIVKMKNGSLSNLDAQKVLSDPKLIAQIKANLTTMGKGAPEIADALSHAVATLEQINTKAPSKANQAFDNVIQKISTIFNSVIGRIKEYIGTAFENTDLMKMADPNEILKKYFGSNWFEVLTGQQSFDSSKNLPFDGQKLVDKIRSWVPDWILDIVDGKTDAKSGMKKEMASVIESVQKWFHELFPNWMWDILNNHKGSSLSDMADMTIDTIKQKVAKAVLPQFVYEQMYDEKGAPITSEQYQKEREQAINEGIHQNDAQRNTYLGQPIGAVGPEIANQAPVVVNTSDKQISSSTLPSPTDIASQQTAGAVKNLVEIASKQQSQPTSISADDGAWYTKNNNSIAKPDYNIPSTQKVTTVQDPTIVSVNSSNSSPVSETIGEKPEDIMKSLIIEAQRQYIALREIMSNTKSMSDKLNQMRVN
jgi:hypothetical protein